MPDRQAPRVEGEGTTARPDQPPQFSYTRGSRGLALEIAQDPARLQAALDAMDEVTFSARSTGPRAARRRLWAEITCAAKLSEEVTPTSVRYVAAVLRDAGYRSAPAIIEQAVQDAIEQGQIISDATRQQVRRVRRACLRGLGPPKRSEALPIGRLNELPDTIEPLTPGGPPWPRRLLIAGGWWLTREIELSNALVSHVSEHNDTVMWLFPVAKTDTQGEGAERAHKCICGTRPGAPSLIAQRECPACTLSSQAKWATKKYGIDAPLFPDSDGHTCTKASIVSTIEEAARLLGLRVTAVSGAPLWGGHALRRGGAQHLARSGVEVWRIQALARHSSAAILKYVENAHIPTLNSLAAEAAAGRSIAALRDELRTLRAEAQHIRANAAAPRGEYRFVVGNTKLHIIADPEERRAVCGFTFRGDARLTNDPNAALLCQRCGTTAASACPSSSESSDSSSSGSVGEA